MVDLKKTQHGDHDPVIGGGPAEPWSLAAAHALCINQLLDCFGDKLLHVWQISIFRNNVKRSCYGGVAHTCEDALREIVMQFRRISYIVFTTPYEVILSGESYNERLLEPEDFDVGVREEKYWGSLYNVTLKNTAPFTTNDGLTGETCFIHIYPTNTREVRFNIEVKSPLEV